MATGIQVEQLTGYLAREVPKTARTQVLNGLQTVGSGLSDLVTIKALLDTVVADANTAGQNEYALEAIPSGWTGNLQSVVAATFNYASKTGISAIA